MRFPHNLTKKTIFHLLTVILFITPVLFSCQDDLTPGQNDDSLTIPPADTWWNDHVFYEIFVRSFYDSNGDGIGDFQGIIKKLDYLNDGNSTTDSDLGITAIWLMPIFPSPSYHGYDVTDYLNVNPQYGTMDDFKQLIVEAHKRGIKVIIDFEINHTSDQHPWFISSAAGSGGKGGWYTWSSFDPGYLGPWGQKVWHARNGGFYYALFYGGMPDLNYYNSEVTNQMKSIINYWHSTIGVDGFRMDAAGALIEEGSNQSNTKSTMDWWRKFYAFQKNLNPGLMTVGEVWSNTQTVKPYSDQRLDYCFEFDLSYVIIDAVKSGNVSGLSQKMKEIEASYSPLQYGTFLTNHDQSRVFSEFGSDVGKAKLAAAIYLSLPGIPYLYYGEEIAMSGMKPDENIRLPMQWSDQMNAGFTTGTPWRTVDFNYPNYNVSTLQKDPTSIWNHYQKLIKARLSLKAMTQGSYKDVTSNNNSLYSFLRIKDGESVLAVHNFTSNAQFMTLSIASSGLAAGSYTAQNVLTGELVTKLNVSSGGSFTDYVPTEKINGYSSMLIKFVKD
jgi:alpha-amylase